MLSFRVRVFLFFVFCLQDPGEQPSMPPSQGCFCSRPAGGLQSSELIPALTVQHVAGEQRLLTLAAQSFFFSLASLLAGVDAEYAFLDLRHVGILFSPPCVLSSFQTCSDADM